MLWSVDLICQVTSGQAFNTENFVLNSSAFSIDTRTINRGDVFFAIKGPNFDGHKFVETAFKKGAALAIVEEPVNTKQPLIVVSNVLSSMQKLATYYISQHPGTVIAITGSVGKTTTKHVLQNILSIYGNTYASPGNFNNHIGLPLSVLRAPINACYLIFELGMSAAGEIKLLSQIVRPKIAIITNITPAHLEFFSSVADIAMAKSEIFSAILCGGSAILNIDNDFFEQLLSVAQLYPQNIKQFINFGCSNKADVRLIENKYSNELINFSVMINSKLFFFNLSCRCQNIIWSVLSSLATLKALDLPIDSSQLAAVISKLQPVEGRGNVHHMEKNQKKLTVIDESYNASPESMHTAIKTLAEYKNHRKVLILGDMLELGNDTIKFHTALLPVIIAAKIDMILITGDTMQHLHNALSNITDTTYFTSYKEITCSLDSLLLDGDVILIKASAAVGLSKIVTYLKTEIV